MTSGIDASSAASRSDHGGAAEAPESVGAAGSVGSGESAGAAARPPPSAPLEPSLTSAVLQVTGWRRVYRATFFSMAGFRAAWKHEAAFRQECVVVAALIPAAFWLGSTAIERAVLVGSCLIVLVVELLNSGIETVVDRIGVGRHELSGRAKDLGSAAVFVSLVLLCAVWALIAWERFG